MEIIILPYMAISFFIAWAIFSPFAEIEDLHDWTFSKIETVDLFAVFLPVCFLLALIQWAAPTDSLPALAWTLIMAAILILSISGFAIGLFLLAKMKPKPPLKRMAIIGVIVPIGSLLTLAWIAFPLFAFARSMFYAMPATLAIVPATLALRWLSGWACKIDDPVV